MKTTIDINGKPVEIELTKEQIEAVRKADQKITDRVKMFDDALGIVGCSPSMAHLLDYRGLNGIDKNVVAAIAFAKLSIVRQALNEAWEPSISSDRERMYHPCFKESSATGFTLDSIGCDVGFLRVGVCHSYKSKELAQYAGTQFKELYRTMLTVSSQF